MDVKKYLKKNSIEFKIHRHEPLFTCEQAKKIINKIGDIHAKNLFLKNKKSKDKFYMIILPMDKNLDIKKFEKKLNTKLSFAKPEELKEILGLTPGSVSPFGLINDKNLQTKLLIDKKIFTSESIGFHPNINTETLELTKENFHKYLNTLKNKIEVFE